MTFLVSHGLQLHDTSINSPNSCAVATWLGPSRRVLLSLPPSGEITPLLPCDHHAAHIVSRKFPSLSSLPLLQKEQSLHVKISSEKKGGNKCVRRGPRQMDDTHFRRTAGASYVCCTLHEGQTGKDKDSSLIIHCPQLHPKKLDFLITFWGKLTKLPRSISTSLSMAAM